VCHHRSHSTKSMPYLRARAASVSASRFEYWPSGPRSLACSIAARSRWNPSLPPRSGTSARPPARTKPPPRRGGCAQAPSGPAASARAQAGRAHRPCRPRRRSTSILRDDKRCRRLAAQPAAYPVARPSYISRTRIRQRSSAICVALDQFPIHFEFRSSRGGAWTGLLLSTSMSFTSLSMSGAGRISTHVKLRDASRESVQHANLLGRKRPVQEGKVVDQADVVAGP